MTGLVQHKERLSLVNGREERTQEQILPMWVALQVSGEKNGQPNKGVLRKTVKNNDRSFKL